MNKSYYFEIKNDRNDEVNIEELNKMLTKVGITLTTVDIKEPSSKLLVFNVDGKAYNLITTRNAGRPGVAYENHRKFDTSITVGEVYKMMDEMSHDQIIKKIGCSRTTYFRYLRKWNDFFIKNNFNKNDFNEAEFFDFYALQK